jgi:DNA-binding NarL/FixJ family response regulator
MVNILLADDHKLILEGLMAYLKKSELKAQINTVSSKSELMYELANMHYNILLLDIFLGDFDTRKLIPELKNKFQHLKIIAISTISDSRTISEIMNLDVDGFVSKSEDSEIILEAIINVSKNQKYLSKSLNKKINHYHNTNNEVTLTNREKEVLKEILKEKSTKEIAHSLCISEKTVEIHRSNLFVKFNVKNVVGLVKNALQNGFQSE